MIGSLLYKTSIEKIPPLDLPSYLAAQELFPKFYHRCQDSGEERAAFGSFVTLPFIPKLTQEVDPSLCFYGALHFPDQKKDPLWNDFPSTLFFLPLYEIRQTATETILLSRPLPSVKPLQVETFLPLPPALEKIRQTPSQKEWSSWIKKTLEYIEKQNISKVILSKQTTFSYEEEVPFFSFLQELKKENPSTSTFAFQTHPRSLFLGSSPERLYQRQEQNLLTEAVAGTRKRKSNPLEDLSCSQDLERSTKDQEEVLFVKNFLEEKLQPLCFSLSCSNQPKMISTKTLWHLRYPFKGTLHPWVTDYELLKALHPTPAVGGVPTEEALSWIHQLEKHARGLYAGSIGWTSSSEGSFTVAIRSALIQKGLVHAFSGAGIVENSKADLEWQELEHKLSHWNVGCLT